MECDNNARTMSHFVAENQAEVQAAPSSSAMCRTMPASQGVLMKTPKTLEFPGVSRSFKNEQHQQSFKHIQTMVAIGSNYC